MSPSVSGKEKEGMRGKEREGMRGKDESQKEEIIANGLCFGREGQRKKQNSKNIHRCEEERGVERWGGRSKCRERK